MKIKDKPQDVPVKSPPPQPWDIDCQAAGDGLTKQEFVKDCDVNEILSRCLRLGLPPLSADGKAAFVWPDADATGIGSFQDAQNRVIAAQEAFMLLPANVRTRFGHDPAQLIAFVGDPSNYDEAVKLGVVTKREPPAPPAPPAPSRAAPAAVAAPAAPPAV